MTLEERATQVAVRLLEDYRDRGGDTSRILSEGGIAYMVAAAIREAVVEEREACAKVAESHARYEAGPPHPDAYTAEACEAVAAGIRARGEPTP